MSMQINNADLVMQHFDKVPFTYKRSYGVCRPTLEMFNT